MGLLSVLVLINGEIHDVLRKKGTKWERKWNQNLHRATWFLFRVHFYRTHKPSNGGERKEKAKDQSLNIRRKLILRCFFISLFLPLFPSPVCVTGVRSRGNRKKQGRSKGRIESGKKKFRENRCDRTEPDHHVSLDSVFTPLSLLKLLLPFTSLHFIVLSNLIISLISHSFVVTRNPVILHTGINVFLPSCSNVHHDRSLVFLGTPASNQEEDLILELLSLGISHCSSNEIPI